MTPYHYVTHEVTVRLKDRTPSAMRWGMQMLENTVEAVGGEVSAKLEVAIGYDGGGTHQVTLTGRWVTKYEYEPSLQFGRA